MDDMEKVQEREYARIYTMIGQRQKDAEDVKLTEEMKAKEEEQKAIQEQERHIAKRLMYEKEQRTREERERIRQAQTEQERREAYERMIQDIQTRNISKGRDVRSLPPSIR